MRVIWEASDIQCGRRYSKAGIGEKWIIGYIPSMTGEARYVSVSDQDGMVTEPRAREQIAQILTENEYLPVELLPRINAE